MPQAALKLPFPDRFRGLVVMQIVCNVLRTSTNEISRDCFYSVSEGSWGGSCPGYTLPLLNFVLLMRFQIFWWLHSGRRFQRGLLFGDFKVHMT